MKKIRHGWIESGRRQAPIYRHAESGWYVMTCTHRWGVECYRLMSNGGAVYVKADGWEWDNLADAMDAAERAPKGGLPDLKLLSGPTAH